MNFLCYDQNNAESSCLIFFFKRASKMEKLIIYPLKILNISEYFQIISSRFKQGNATEHTYRGDLSQLVESLVKGISCTNEPKRQQCGAPDYILTKGEIPIGYIEAKDIGESLDKTEKSEQIKRYKASLDNLFITDYLEFRLFRNGEKVASVKIAELDEGKLKPLKGNWDQFDSLIKDFCTYSGQTIKSAPKLAKIMAGKAKLMQDIIFKALKDEAETTLRDQMEAFKQVLIHDIDEATFADIYSQTIAYGMFAARFHDDTLEDFSRKEAAELVPKSNPFLRKLFHYIAGYDLDDRLVWIVDALAEVFRACDLKKILKEFGSSTQRNDPIIHFYETFLAEYNPKLRKSKGVYYTPEPIVNFIVRAVDEILKTDFALPMGLADTSQIEIDSEVYDGKKYKKVKQKIDKVQILDPATGTGTFLSEVIKHIYKNFEGQQGIWSKYVDEHLIPRLNGFELLMASYAVAHLKLDLLLQETGYKPKDPKNPQRFRVFLTNALEEAHPHTGSLFANWLSVEAQEANEIKKNTPVMVLMGNPPYSVSSSNKGEWILELIKEYKKDLNEKNINPLSDDYIKFIRYAQHFIDKNGQGIVAMITNNSFLDGVIHRQMRKSLSESFDKIYIYDLHGNSKKQEKTLEGSVDENVFDIQQGVSINIFVKTGKTKITKSIVHIDSFGKREEKYEHLWNNTIESINWTELSLKTPEYYFIQKDCCGEDEYKQGFSVNELFVVNASGIKTHDDTNLVDFDSFPNNNQKYSYRAFDTRFINYDLEKVQRHRYPTMKHMLLGKNFGIVFSRQSTSEYWTNLQITDSMIDNRYHFSYKGIPNQAPLYLYQDQPNPQTSLIDKEPERKPNLKDEIVNEIANKLGLKFTSEKLPPTPLERGNSEDQGFSSSLQGGGGGNSFAPIDLLDYIYAVLHSPSYREKYKEFLKVDFPRVPYPDNQERFWKLIEKGSELRGLHLLESSKVNKYITSYPQDGSNQVEKVEFKDESKVYINSEQYFDNVPKIAWEFYIGGYQPAQKWLKDRKGRELSYEDILHYQRIIVALTETDRLMKEIDKIGVENAEFAISAGGRK